MRTTPPSTSSCSTPRTRPRNTIIWHFAFGPHQRKSSAATTRRFITTSATPRTSRSTATRSASNQNALRMGDSEPDPHGRIPGDVEVQSRRGTFKERTRHPARDAGSRARSNHQGFDQSRRHCSRPVRRIRNNSSGRKETEPPIRRRRSSSPAYVAGIGCQTCCHRRPVARRVRERKGISMSCQSLPARASCSVCEAAARVVPQRMTACTCAEANRNRSKWRAMKNARPTKTASDFTAALTMTGTNGTDTPVGTVNPRRRRRRRSGPTGSRERSDTPPE